MILEALETNCDITCSQLDSTITSAASISARNIIVNPDPSILKHTKKLNILRKWERKFKEGNCVDLNITVKLELKDHNLATNVTHYVIDDINDCGMTETDVTLYSTPFYESLIMGAWILNFQWITDSLDNDEILNEEKYKVIDLQKLR